MVVGLSAAVVALALAGWALAEGSTSGSAVLLVGTYHGKTGPYASIQAAVDAAQPGDWILVAPGDYHEADDAHVTSAAQLSAGDHGGVVVTTSDIHIRGLNRNTVVVDGTKAGSSTCSAAPHDQNLGPVVGGKAQGRNGIVVWKANNVSIENLTVCNFQGGPGDSGNEVWWNGGDGSGKIGLTGYTGRYLTGTTSFFSTEGTSAGYGIFSSNAQGPGRWDQIYGSNMSDSGMYVGACLQVCDVTIDHAWMENNALGYSGTNSGGSLVIENSWFDHNEDGVDTNSQIAGDPPPPQNGACPNGGTSPITHTHSCWVFIHNNVHDNNNPNVPQAGNAAAGPIGTGMTLAGGRNDTVMDNTFANNGAWGTLFIPYPDSGTPSLNQKCANYGGFEVSGLGCVFEDMNDRLAGNTYVHDGFFGNPTNADFGQIVLHAGQPSNCYVANNAPLGGAPPYLEVLQPTCGVPSKTTNLEGALVTQVECDSGLASCPAGTQYPAKSAVQLEPLPRGLPTMADPCAGVPSNAWCAPGSALGTTTVHGGNGAHAAVAPIAAGVAYRRASL
jgi:hypothetical protein